ncbi:32474_t:CDS:1, partial [Gigaspora margarita]
SLKKINKISYEEIDNGVKNILNDEKYKLSWINYNDFNQIREIGKGGFATVFFAYWYNKNDNIYRTVALKVIHNSNKEVENFIQEL